MGALNELRDRLQAGLRRQPPQLRDRLRAVAAAIVVVGLFLVLVLGTTLPVQTSVHTDMRVVSFSEPPPSAHGSGCGKYWESAQIGHGLGPTIQIAAGFCWTGKRIRWIWGLHRNDCQPLNSAVTQVRLTCHITGGGRRGLDVIYEARVTPSLLPIATRTVTMHINVLPQGCVIRFPT